MSEERATAVLMANLKGRKKNKPSDWIEIAEACNKLRNSQNWGLQKMTEYFGVTDYLLRQIDSLNNLESGVKELVRKREPLLGLDECFLISRLPKPKQLTVAKFAIQSKILSKELRQLCYLIDKYPNKSLSEIKSQFQRTRQKKIRLLVLPLDSERYDKLRKQARDSHLKIHDYVFRLIEENLNEQ